MNVGIFEGTRLLIVFNDVYAHKWTGCCKMQFDRVAPGVRKTIPFDSTAVLSNKSL